MLDPRREKLHPHNSNPDLSTWSDSEVEAEFLDVANVRIRYLDFRALEDTDKLSLYAHYKQGTVGDSSERTTPLDDKGAIKNLFWKSLQGMSRADAQRNYLATYHRLRRQLHGEDELPKIQEILLDTIIQTRHRKQWLREGYARQSLIPFRTEYFTTLYPDQLSPEMAAEYASKVGVRYKHTIAQRYLVDLRATRPPTPVNDAQFQFFLTEMSYSKLIFPLSSLERSKQLPYLELFGLNGDSGDIHLIDTTPVHALPIQPESGCHLGPAVICLVRDPATRELRPTAIALENINAVEHFPPRVDFPETLKTLHVVHPDHGLAWELAKLYALQGVDYVLGLGGHVVLHVSLMIPIALALQDTLRQCGAHSVYGRMLEEHTYLLLATNSFVLHSEYSVLWPDCRQQPYDAFCVSADLEKEDFDDLGGAFQVARLMLSGWRNHPFFTEVDDARMLHNGNGASDLGTYRALLRRVKETVDAFVQGIAALVGSDDEEQRFVRIFRERLMAHLPEKSRLAGELRAVTDDGWMREVLSYAICNSIEHSIDHFQAGMMAEATHPRLRQPIDFADRSRDPAHIHTRVGALNTLSDRSKYYLLNEITKKDITVKTYGDLFFKEGGYFGGRAHGRKEALRGLEQRFAARMTELCAASGSDHVEFCDIATSIQF